MAPSIQSHSRSHSLLLLQKLLNLRDSASPLTLVLDTLEQTAGPLVREFTTRAKIARSKVIFVSFATVKRPHDVDVFVKARGKSLKVLRAEVASQCPAAGAAPGKDDSPQRALVVIDSLNSLAAAEPQFLSAFLSTIITPTASVVATFHTDVPLVLPKTFSEYDPLPLTLLCHLATAVLRVSSLTQAVERQKARDRSLQEPEWGIKEGREGVLVGLKGSEPSAKTSGIVIDMELRRRSGRGVTETFIMGRQDAGKTGLSPLSLLSDHPLFARPAESDPSGNGAAGEEEVESTFNLGLTEKQRKDREGIVLPYFDAQQDIGGGEGGRILYEMGREDDFDDEEDEI